MERIVVTKEDRAAIRAVYQPLIDGIQGRPGTVNYDEWLAAVDRLFPLAPASNCNEGHEQMNTTERESAFSIAREIVAGLNDPETTGPQFLSFMKTCVTTDDISRMAEALLSVPQEALVLLERAESIMENSSVLSGVCCCGDDMDEHPSPLSCGHSPVDSGSYAVSGFIDDLIKFRAAVRETEGPDEVGEQGLRPSSDGAHP